MRDSGEVKVKLLIEGVEVPCLGVTRTRSQGNTAMLNASVFSSSKLRHLTQNSSVMAFVYSDLVGEYELFFSGRLVAKGVTEGSQSNGMQISATGFVGTLAEMPTMIYQVGQDYGYQHSVGTKYFLGQDPDAQFSSAIVETLYENIKGSIKTAIGETARYYIDMAGKMSPMQEKMNRMSRVRKSMSFESNGTLSEIVGSTLMQKIAKALQELPPSATVWDVIGYMLGFGKLDIIEVVDGVEIDGNDVSMMNSLIKPVMHFMRPPMCNTVLMAEESNATLTFSDSSVNTETRVAVMNSSYNTSMIAVSGFSAFSPDEADAVVRALTDERLKAIEDDRDPKPLSEKTLKEIYTSEELLRGQVIALPQATPLNNVSSDQQADWMRSLADYTYDITKYSRRSLNISNLTLNRNLVPGMPVTVITRLGEKIVGVIHSVSDSINFEQGSAVTSISIGNPVYQDEFGAIEGFSMTEAESSLRHFDDKFKPDEINDVYKKYGMGDSSAMTDRDAPTTVSDYVNDIANIYSGLTSFNQYAETFTRRIYTLAEMEEAFLGSGSSKAVWGYAASIGAEDKAGANYNGPPFLTERQALARDYREDVIGEATSIQLSGVTLAVSDA